MKNTNERFLLYSKKRKAYYSGGFHFDDKSWTKDIIDANHYKKECNAEKAGSGRVYYDGEGKYLPEAEYFTQRNIAYSKSGPSWRGHSTVEFDDKRYEIHSAIFTTPKMKRIKKTIKTSVNDYYDATKKKNQDNRIRSLQRSAWWLQRG